MNPPIYIYGMYTKDFLEIILLLFCNHFYQASNFDESLKEISLKRFATSKNFTVTV